MGGMSDKRYGIREGEVAVDLPDRFDASLYFVGRIRTPWTRREDCCRGQWRPKPFPPR